MVNETQAKRGPRLAALSFTAVAAFLVVVGVAYACTTFNGKVTVTAGGGSSTSTGNGTGMGFCTGTPTGGAQLTVNTAGSAVVAVAPAKCSGTTYQLSSGTYQVRWVNWESSQSGFKRSAGGAYSWWRDCMAGGTPNGTQVGTITVGGTGIASTTVSIGSSLITSRNNNTNPGDASAICVTDSGAFEGNQVPVAVI